MDDLGRRIKAACAYASLTGTASLAHRIGITQDILQQIEDGVVQLEGVDQASMIKAVGEVTGMPPAFFTADLSQLEPGWQAPEDQLDRLEKTIRSLVEKVDGLADRADEQLREGSQRLDQFAATYLPLIERLDRIEAALALGRQTP